MANIEERVEALVSTPITDLGYRLYDVLYVKEGKDYFCVSLSIIPLELV